MSKTTTVESSTRPTPTINPVLQAALSCIEVDLEEELARYRRQKSGRPATATRTLGRNQTRKSLELISVGTEGNIERSPAVEMLNATPTSYGQLALVDSTAIPRLTDRTVSMDVSSPDSGEPVSFSITVAKNATSPNDNPASVNSSPLDTPQQEAAVGVNLANPSATNSSPDDYLASSEQLLRSLAEEDAAGKTERSFLDKVLTPLGVGLLLLLLLSSATVGYIVMNPSSLTYLGLDRFWKPKTPIAQSPTDATPTANNQSKGAPILNGPNLASDEFADLNLNNLSSVRAVPNDGVSQLPTQSVPRVAAGAVTAQLPGQPSSGSSSDLASAILPPTGSSTSVSPRIPSVAPIPATSATPVAKGIQVPGMMSTPSTSSQRSDRGKDFYYVLTNYESDRSLSLARKVVSDAYIRNFPDGSRIQLGFFPKESQAQALVQQLQKQGISAWVYHP